jgi:hypothetical protein
VINRGPGWAHRSGTPPDDTGRGNRRFNNANPTSAPDPSSGADGFCRGRFPLVVSAADSLESASSESFASFSFFASPFRPSLPSGSPSPPSTVVPSPDSPSAASAVRSSSVSPSEVTSAATSPTPATVSGVKTARVAKACGVCKSPNRPPAGLGHERPSVRLQHLSQGPGPAGTDGAEHLAMQGRHPRAEPVEILPAMPPQHRGDGRHGVAATA